VGRLIAAARLIGAISCLGIVVGNTILIFDEFIRIDALAETIHHGSDLYSRVTVGRGTHAEAELIGDGVISFLFSSILLYSATSILLVLASAARSITNSKIVSIFIVPICAPFLFCSIGKIVGVLEFAPVSANSYSKRRAHRKSRIIFVLSIVNTFLYLIWLYISFRIDSAIISFFNHALFAFIAVLSAIEKIILFLILAFFNVGDTVDLRHSHSPTPSRERVAP
jgi:hypothetical protein